MVGRRVQRDQLRGLVLRGTTKIWDSSLAGIGMLWAKAQGGAVLRAYTDRVYETSCAASSCAWNRPWS